LITAIFKLLCYFASAMDEIEPWPVNEDVRAAQKAGRLAYLLETAAIVLLAALAAYAAST
jgi:hypothetical protein